MEGGGHSCQWVCVLLESVLCNAALNFNVRRRRRRRHRLDCLWITTAWVCQPRVCLVLIWCGLVQWTDYSTPFFLLLLLFFFSLPVKPSKTMSAQQDGDGTSATRTIWKLESSICDAPQYSPSIFQLQRREWFFILFYFFFSPSKALQAGSWIQVKQKLTASFWACVKWSSWGSSKKSLFSLLVLNNKKKRKWSQAVFSLPFLPPLPPPTGLFQHITSHILTQDEVGNCFDTNMTAKMQARRRLNEKYIYFCEGDLVSVPLSG